MFGSPLQYKIVIKPNTEQRTEDRYKSKLTETPVIIEKIKITLYKK